MFPRSPESSRVRRTSLPKAGPLSTVRRQESVDILIQRPTIQEIESYVRSKFGTGKTDAQREFINTLNENGKFSLHLMILFVCTMWYMSIVLVHMFTVQATNYIQLRCEIPDLEEYFSYDQILNISFKHKQLSVKDEMSKQYCKYDVRDYAKLAAANNYDYDAIMTSINAETTDPPQKSCNKYKILLNRGSERVLTSISIRMEFEFFCDQHIWNKAIFMIWAYGCAFSNLFGGIAADIFGRKKTFIVTSFLHLLGYAIFAIPSKWCLLIGKFLIGFGSIAYTIIYVLFLEMCHTKTLLWMGLLVYLYTPIATMICFVLRRNMDEWRDVHFANMAMLLLLPFTIWYITESPRWLMFVGNESAAWATMKESYGIEVPSHVNLEVPAPPRPTIMGILKQLFQNIFRERLIICLILCLIESVSMYVETRELTRDVVFHTSRFYIITAIAEFFIILFAGISAIKYGRRTVIFVIYCLLSFHNGIIFMVNQYQENTSSDIIAVLLDTHLAMSQAVVRLLRFYVAELFPTPVRLTALGFCRAVYDLGATLQYHLYMVFPGVPKCHSQLAFVVGIEAICTYLNRKDRKLPDLLPLSNRVTINEYVINRIKEVMLCLKDIISQQEEQLGADL